MIHALLHTTAGREFAIADAINDMGAWATAPRALHRERDANRKWVTKDIPALASYLFAAMTTDEWHRMNAGIMINGHRIKPRTIAHIVRQEWTGVQVFAARVEQDYLFAAEAQTRAASAGQRYVCPYRPGDAIQLLGDTLRDTMARFTRAYQDGGQDMIEAEMQIMGRPVKVKARPDAVAAWPFTNVTAFGGELAK